MTKSIQRQLRLASLILTLSLTFGVSAYADNLCGFVFKTSNGYVYSPSYNPNDPDAGPLQTVDSEVLHTLGQLSDGDQITGEGSQTDGTWTLTEIDYVGLSQLLGTWNSGNYSISFNSYASAIGNLPTPAGLGHFSSYNYSVVPTDDNSWRLLLSNGNNTHLARMILTDSGLELQFIDSSTGNIVTTLSFSKVGSNE